MLSRTSSSLEHLASFGHRAEEISFRSPLLCESFLYRTKVQLTSRMPMYTINACAARRARKEPALIFKEKMYEDLGAPFGRGWGTSCWRRRPRRPRSWWAADEAGRGCGTCSASGIHSRLAQRCGHSAGDFGCLGAHWRDHRALRDRRPGGCVRGFVKAALDADRGPCGRELDCPNELLLVGWSLRSGPL
jgi:hypothetical protein